MSLYISFEHLTAECALVRPSPPLGEELDGRFEHFVTTRADSFEGRRDANIGNEANALQLPPVRVLHAEA
jgi:hypothetical protein